MFAATAPTRALTAPQTGLMSGWTGAMAMPAAEMAGCVFAVQLIDRRTGSVHRINGAPLIVFTRQPDEAAADLLRNRDTRVWTTRSEALPKGGRG